MKSFVLKTGPLGERDLIVTAISRKRGKERLRAPGVRRSGAKLKGHVQPLSWSVIHTAEGRVYRVIIDAENLEDSDAFSSKVIRALLFLSDMVDSITIEGGSTDIFFSYLERATSTVRSPETSHPMSSALFWGVRLLDEAGYALSIDLCSNCGVVLGNEIGWSFTSKGFICRECLNSQEDASSVSVECIKVLRFLKYSGEDHASRLKLNDVLQLEVCLILRNLARLLSGSPLV